MTDVNVTEKVARAIREPDYIGCGCCAEINGLDFGAADPCAEGIARLALAALSDPEVLAGMAGVLYEADPLPGKPSWDGLRSESAQWPDGVARWAETRALERASALADWLRGHR